MAARRPESAARQHESTAMNLPSSRLYGRHLGRPREPTHVHWADEQRPYHPVMLEPRNGRAMNSINNWIADVPSPIIQERRPSRRRSSIGSDSSGHYLPARPIVLPPLPSKLRRKSTKKKLYFVRPHDGRPGHRRGTIGRLKDALTGKGPDVFVTSSTRERLLRDRPQRWQWSGHGPSDKDILTQIVQPDFEWSELQPVMEAPWARRQPWEGYDFRTRRYGALDEHVWTDARWLAGASRGSAPYEIRDANFDRWQRVA